MIEFKYNNGYKEVVLNEEDIFKISFEKEHLSNKKIDYHTLMLMTLFSSDHSEDTCSEDGYVYTNRDVLSDNLELVEDISNKKLNSIFKTIKKMEDLDIITKSKGYSGSIIYKI